MPDKLIPFRADAYMRARVEGLQNLMGYTEIAESDLRRVIAGCEDLTHRLKAMLPQKPRPKRNAGASEALQEAYDVLMNRETTP